MTLHCDERGKLTFGEAEQTLPFVPRRYFLVFDAPPGTARGGHAHKACHQFLIAVSGTVTVTLDDGTTRSDVTLDRPNQGLHVPPGVWSEQRYNDGESRLLVLASHRYDASDYVHDYREFLQMHGAER